MCAANGHVRFAPDSDRESVSANMCGATRDVRFGPKADIGPSTHLRFWPSLIEELPAGSAGAFLEALMPSADKINFVKMIVCPLRSAAKSPVAQ
jgi:hypothetical protein